MRKGFTLIELLLVIAVIVALAITVFVALNPAQRLAEARDAKRVSDMSSFQDAMQLYQNDAAFAGQVPFLGTSGTIYISVPDPTATTTAGSNCAGLALTGSYHCAASSTYQMVNGTGWIPVNFTSVSSTPFSQLPIDPVNTTSSGEYYEYATDGAGNWEILSTPESIYDQSSTAAFSAGTNDGLIALASIATPVITSLSNTSTCSSAFPPVVFSIYGTGFTPSSSVQWTCANTLVTTFTSSTQLSASSSYTCSAGVYTITVVNPGGKVSNGQNFTFTTCGF